MIFDKTSVTFKACYFKIHWILIFYLQSVSFGQTLENNMALYPSFNYHDIVLNLSSCFLCVCLFLHDNLKKSKSKQFVV